MLHLANQHKPLQKDQQGINDSITRIFHMRQAVKWITLNSNINGSIDRSPLFSYQVDLNIGQDQHQVDHTGPSEFE
jgi:hypothetical protein